MAFTKRSMLTSWQTCSHAAELQSSGPLWPWDAPRGLSTLQSPGPTGNTPRLAASWTLRSSMTFMPYGVLSWTQAQAAACPALRPCKTRHTRPGRAYHWPPNQTMLWAPTVSPETWMKRSDSMQRSYCNKVVALDMSHNLTRPKGLSCCRAAGWQPSCFVSGSSRPAEKQVSEGDLRGARKCRLRLRLHYILSYTHTFPSCCPSPSVLGLTRLHSVHTLGGLLDYNTPLWFELNEATMSWFGLRHHFLSAGVEPRAFL